jgi:ATP-binding cassette subfamily B protein
MKNVNRALAYLRKYRLPAAGALLSLLLVNVANVVTPLILGFLIDEGISPVLGVPRMDAVWLATGALLFVALIRGVFNFLQGYWSEVASQGVAFDLRNIIFEKLQNLSFSYHDRAQTGKLMTRMTSDVDIVRMYVGGGFLQLLSAVVMLLGTVIILFILNWRLAFIMLGVIPAIGGIFFMLVRRIMPVSRDVQRKLGALNTILQENLAGIRVVKAFAREEYELDRYLRQNDELFDENIKFIRLFTTFFPLVFFVANLGMLAIVWAGGLQVIGGQLSLGQLVAFISYLGFILMPLFMVGMVSAMLSRAEASAVRIFEVIDAASEVQETEDAVALENVSGRIAFEDVSFRYVGGERDVLSSLSFEAEPGQTIAILGQTGSGKSTIINLIPRFYDVSAGRILIDDKDIRDLKLESLRTQIGIVLQETTLFSGAIRENISYGRPDASLADVRAAAEAAQAAGFIEELPDKYDTLVGERGVGLSGGQKQRVAIARALLVDPKILILDDSTSAVDAETEYKIQQALDRLMQGRTSFVIAQRISTVRNADMILLLDEGRLVAHGTHAELLETSELYNEILDTQFGDWRYKAKAEARVQEAAP